MLPFEKKLQIIESFPELQRNDVSLKRVNFQYLESDSNKKNVVYHLHPNGNGYVYAELLNGYEINEKGMVNIRDFSKEELQSVIEKSIQSLKPKSTEELAIVGDSEEERWMDAENHTLLCVYEDGFWNIYAGLNLEESFSSYNEAKQHLEEEGFKLG